MTQEEMDDIRLGIMRVLRALKGNRMSYSEAVRTLTELLVSED